LRNVLILQIEEFRETNAMPNSPAILFLDNCSNHLIGSVIDLLSAHNVKIIPFPAHSSAIFQMLDLVFFGVFKKGKSRLSKPQSIPVTEGHARPVFSACGTAGASTTVRGSFARAGFTYDKNPDGADVMGFNEQKIRDSAEFRELWEINCPLEAVSVRQRPNRWGFLNSAALLDK
jgi:hypothetical protein